MDIEDYALAHHHFWADDFGNQNLEILIHKYFPEKMIDIGCGDGAFLYALKTRGFLERIKEVWATDLSSHRLVEIKKISSEIHTVQDDAQELSNIPKFYFDLVISTQVIEHVKDDLKMLESIRNICKSGGVVFIETIFKKPNAWYFNKNAYGESVLDPTHEREYQDENELFEKIKKADLYLLSSTKEPLKFPLLDFFVRRIRFLNNPGLFEQYPFLKWMRRIKIPILGYYKWSLVLLKK